MIFPIKRHPNRTITFLAVVLSSIFLLQIIIIYHPLDNEISSEYNTEQLKSLRDNPDFSRSQSSPLSYFEITVFDAATSLPIEAASVTVKDEITGANLYSGQTNTGGVVNVTDIYVGTFKITVSKISPSLYRTEEFFRKIDILGEIISVKAYLTLESEINGIVETKVLDITGMPIPGVFVDILNDEGSLITRTSTNETGVALTSEPLEEGNYIVSATIAGYYSKNASIKLEWYGDYKRVSIVLLPKGTSSASIEITTKDAITENNLSNTFIDIFDSNGNSVWSGMTNADGFAIASELDMGYYQVTAQYDTYNGVEKEINLHYPGDYEKLPFSLYPTSSNEGFIEVYAVTEESSEVPSASITLYNHKNQQITTGLTDDSGFYNITNLAEGTYYLKVSADTFFDNNQEIIIRWNTDYKKLEVVMISQNKVGDLQVEFLDISGAPLSSVLVKLVENEEIVQSGFTDKGSITIFDLPMGIYNLEASKRGFKTFKTKINLFLEKSCVISETLTPSKGSGSFNVNTPLNAYVLVQDSNGETVFSGESESGETTVSGLPIGDYSVSMFTDSGSQSVSESINWYGQNQGLTLQDLIDITDNSSCIEFTIWDIDDGLVENCRVDVITQNGFSFFGHTDVNGFVNITGLFLGTYDVVCHKYEYRDTVTTKSIDYTGQKKISNLYIYKAYGNIHVHITDAYSGDPYPAYVRYKTQWWGEWTPLVRADTNGYLGFHNIPVGYYNFSVMSGAYETQYAWASIGFDGEMVHLNFDLIYPGGDGQINYYALIVAGGTEQRFTHDAYGLYKTLTQYYSFTSSNTFLLTPHAVDSVSGDTVPRDASTSFLQVEWAINQIGMLADADDQVVVLWTGHGGFLVGGPNNDVIIEGQFQTGADAIGAPDFDQFLDGISCNHMYIFLGPCHSGYWINELSGEQNRAIYTSCNWDETAWAYSDHSYWPWGIRKSLDPNLSASSADDDNNGKVSLYESYEYTDHYVRVTKNKNQHPQRFVGQDVAYGSDFYKYIGDGTYNSPIVGRGSAELSGVRAKISTASTTRSYVYVDESTGIAIIPSAGVIDDLWDNSDISFEIYNATRFPDHIPISNIQIIIRDIFGSILDSGFSNSDGFITLYDFPEGIYAWEAFYGDLPINSGQIFVQQAQAVSYAFSDNYDYQGDAADIKIQVEEAKKGINLENVIVELYHANGNYIGSKTSNFNGEALFLDVEDGLYGYKVTFDETTLTDGNIRVRSSTFTLETDITSPKVDIISPTSDDTYDLSNTLPSLTYNVEEENNYSIVVYLNGNSLGYKPNNHILTEITTPGVYSLKVEAVDVAENIGYEIIEFTVIDSETSSSTSSGFSLIISLVMMIFLTSTFRKYKKSE